MKRLFLLSLLTAFLIPSLKAQVANYAKPLPVRSYSVAVAPSWYFNNGTVGLRSIGVEEDVPGAMVVGVAGGYSLNYSADMGAKVMYVFGGKPFFGVDLQYLLYESRFSYFSVVGGLHYWDNVGVDLTGLFTFAPRYSWNFTFGLDLDVNYDPDMESKVRTRIWLPVNVAYNISDYTLVFAEFDLQVSQWSWGIFSLGASFIFR